MLKNVFRIILIISLAWTFYTIFQFSGENATESSERSGSIIINIVNILPATKNLSENEKQEIVEKVQPIIRKLAHFSIYAYVGVLMMSFASTYQLLLWKKSTISVVTGLLYAISDEYHQSFVPGRSAQWQDVLIDLTGVIVGSIIVLICISIYKKNKYRKVTEQRFDNNENIC